MPALADRPKSRDAVSSSVTINGRHTSAPTMNPEPEPRPAPSIDELVFDYLTLSLPLPALSRRHSMTLEQLATLLESAPVQSLIRRLTRLAAQRARVLAVQNRSSAIASLETTVATTDNPETARKAAATLIRASDRVLYPARRKRAAKGEKSASVTTTATTGAPPVADTRATPSAATQGSSTPTPDSSPCAPPPHRSSSGAG